MRLGINFALKGVLDSGQGGRCMDWSGIGEFLTHCGWSWWADWTAIHNVQIDVDAFLPERK